MSLGTLLGPLHTKAAIKEYTDGLEEIKKQGGKVLIGGNVVGGPGNFVEATIVEIDPAAPIVKTELFVPILYVMKFKVRGKRRCLGQSHSPCTGSAVDAGCVRVLSHVLVDVRGGGGYEQQRASGPVVVAVHDGHEEGVQVDGVCICSCSISAHAVCTTLADG